MRRRFHGIGGFASAAVVLLLIGAAGAEQCKLDVKRFTPLGRIGPEGPPVEALFQRSYPQSFFIQIGAAPRRSVRPGDDKKPVFSEVITKEPAQYAAAEPLRGVVKLGDAYYGFVLDSVEPKEDKTPPSKEDKALEQDKASKLSKTREQSTRGVQPEGDQKAAPPAAEKEKKAIGAVGRPAARRLRATKEPDKNAVKALVYNRLYFDRNHNGDLTDDPVVEAPPARRVMASYSNSRFPPIDVAFEFDGAKIDYRFVLRVSVRRTSTYAYASGYITAAVYREGEMTLGGKRWRVVVTDGNSNGRFDDPTTITYPRERPRRMPYPNFGDMIFLLDPETKHASGNPYDPTSNAFAHPVGKWLSLDGRLYDLSVSPAGDRVSLAPSAMPVGCVTNPNQGYRALVYGPLGVLKIMGDTSGQAVLPAGAWSPLSYTIDRTKPAAASETVLKKETAAEKDAQKTAKKEATEKNADRKSAQARDTIVAGQAREESKPVAVVENQTVAMPFGPPYEPVITARIMIKDKSRLSLGMTLVGTGGDTCNRLLVDGRRPPKPTFTITTEDGKPVHTDVFEYG